MGDREEEPILGRGRGRGGKGNAKLVRITLAFVVGFVGDVSWEV